MQELVKVKYDILAGLTAKAGGDKLYKAFVNDFTMYMCMLSSADGPATPQESKYIGDFGAVRMNVQTIDYVAKEQDFWGMGQFCRSIPDSLLYFIRIDEKMIEACKVHKELDFDIGMSEMMLDLYIRAGLELLSYDGYSKKSELKAIKNYCGMLNTYIENNLSVPMKENYMKVLESSESLRVLRQDVKEHFDSIYEYIDSATHKHMLMANLVDYIYYIESASGKLPEEAFVFAEDLLGSNIDHEEIENRALKIDREAFSNNIPRSLRMAVEAGDRKLAESILSLYEELGMNISRSGGTVDMPKTLAFGEYRLKLKEYLG